MLKNSFKLLGIVRAEKYIVSVQRQARGGGVQRPSNGRQRARLHFSGYRLPCPCAKQSRAQGGNVAIKNHAVGRQALATLQAHTTHTTLGEFDALTLAVELELNTSLAAQAHKALGQGMHATLHRPHTVHLHLGNQHQGSGRLPRRGAAVAFAPWQTSTT